MDKILHILLVEDDALDAELATNKLVESGFTCDCVPVETEETFRQSLTRPDLDLILSDYALPKFTGLQALKIAREIRPDLPFIFISGFLGEDTAVEMLKEGATDYVLKQRLERLVPAVKRAISEARERVDRKRAEEALRIERKWAEEEREALLASERAARTEAEHASRMKDEFLATLGHELRTPLNAIVGWSQLLSTGKNSEEDLAEGLAIIERNARAQTRIIEDLMDMSRIVSGKVRLDVQWFDLTEVITAAIESIRPSVEAKGIHIQQVLDSSAGPMRGDPGRLQQVIWNLLSNAIKFTPRGGQVQVLLERVNAHVEIIVSDTGIGIKPDFVPHVFDRFRQADASTTRHHGGLGLGLSIVKQLVEIHGGNVRARSAGEGKGSTFIVTLPLPVLKAGDAAREGDPSPREAAAIHGSERPRLNGVRVLMVDDEPDARHLVRRILEECGANVLTAGSAAEAMAAITRALPDVLVSDIGMPDRDGYDLLRQIRALPLDKGGTLPAIALTAFARSEDRTRAIMAGFDMHISKPVEPGELCAVVARMADRMKSAAV